MSATLTSDPPSTTAPDPKRWLALTVIAVAQLMLVLDSSIVNIALPSAQTALGISDADRHWIVTAYTLTFGGFLLLGGRIADFMGRRRAFLFGLIAFSLASALGGIAQDGATLFAARALQGVFAALMAPAALSLIAVTFTESTERAKAFGVYGAISGGGAAIGLIAGGVLTEYTSWRWCLLVNVPISLVTAVFAARLVKESKATGDTRYDIPGALTVTAGLVALVYGFTHASIDGWTSPTTMTLLALSAVLLAVFVVIEQRTSHPLLPMRIVLDRNRGGSFLGMMLAISGMFAMFLFLTFYFQGTLGYSALRTGFAFLPFSVGIIFSAAIASKLLPKFGPRPLMIFGYVLATLGMLWLTQIEVEGSFVQHILPSELLMSIGMGFAFVPASATALYGVKEHDAGVASAALNTSQQIGGALGTALLNTIYTSAAANYIASHGTSQAAQAASQVHGYIVGFACGTGVLIAAGIVTAFFISAKKEEVATVEAAVVAA